MDVKPGYRQIEPGKMPEDWEMQSLGDGIALSSGQHVLTRHYNTDGTGVPYLTGPADFPKGIIRHTKFTTKPGTICHSRDILITVKGSGAGTLVIADREYCISRQLMAIRPYTWDSLYIYYSLLRDMTLFGANASGPIPGLSRGDILGKQIALPPTNAEQEAIAQALSDADALIDSLEHLVAKKRNLKQGAMQELLTGKKRLPGFSGDWQVKRIGELLSIQHGKNQHSVADVNGDYHILATGGQIGRANRFLYDKPSVLIGRKGTIDEPRYMDQPFWTVDTLFYSIIQEANNAKFLFYRFCLVDWKQYNEASGVPSLNARTIERIEMRVPSPDEQISIANILSDMDAEIAGLEAKLTKARQIKQGMMQELLTGKTRLT
jgi:type I restriction enzyme S subunit